MAAREGTITEAMRAVAETEYLSPEFIHDETAAGRLVIPANPAHTGLHPIGIGRALRTKINANLGNSALSSDAGMELEKLNVALRHGADTVMDLSTGADVNAIRTSIIRHSPAPVGTVPKPGDLDVGGLQISDAEIAELLRIDLDGWKGEVPEIEAYLNQAGDRLPARMKAQLAALK